MHSESERVNEFEVYFELQGKNFEPSDISHILDIKATTIHKAEHDTHRASHWVLSSGIQKGTVIDIGVAVESLINKLKPVEQKIIDIINKYQLKTYLEIEVRLAPHIFSRNFEKLDDVHIAFEPEELCFLGAVKAILNVDIEY